MNPGSLAIPGSQSRWIPPAAGGRPLVPSRRQQHVGVDLEAKLHPFWPQDLSPCPGLHRTAGFPGGDKLEVDLVHIGARRILIRHHPYLPCEHTASRTPMRARKVHMVRHATNPRQDRRGGDGERPLPPSQDEDGFRRVDLWCLFPLATVDIFRGPRVVRHPATGAK